MVKSKLFVLGIERELLWTELEYYRFMNRSGRPSSQPMGGLFTLAFPSAYDDDRLLSWMTSEPENELCTLTEGKIVFYGEGVDESALFEYKFNDAALVFWKESFTAIGEGPMTVTITISAAIQEVKNVTYVKTWQESWTPPSNSKPHQTKEDDSATPKLIAFYLTDEEGRRIEEYAVGDTIILNILTENRIGEKLKINLGDATHDFEYQGSVLYNDTIENFTITKDEEQLSLKVLEQR